MSKTQNTDPSKPSLETAEQRKASIDHSFGKSRLLREGEHDNLLGRFQSIWSELNNAPAEDAPCMYIHENSHVENAYYQHVDNYYGVTDKILNTMSLQEVDAILYHEVGHDILGHSHTESLQDILVDVSQDTVSTEFERLTEGYNRVVDAAQSSQKNELEADSIATIHCQGEHLVSGLEKMDARQNYETPFESELGEVPIIGDWLKRKVTEFKQQFSTHPSFEERKSESNRLSEVYCPNPEDINGPFINEYGEVLGNPFENPDQFIQNVLKEHRDKVNSTMKEIKDCSLEISDSCNVQLDVGVKTIPLQKDSCEIRVGG